MENPNPFSANLNDSNKASGKNTFYMALSAFAILGVGTYLGMNSQNTINYFQHSFAASNQYSPTLNNTVQNSNGILTAGTYKYKITANIGDTESTDSNIITATTTGSTSSVILTWNANPDATSYNIYKYSDVTGDYVLYDTSKSNSYTDAGDTSSQVRLVSSKQNGKPSNGYTNNVTAATPDQRFIVFDSDATNLTSDYICSTCSPNLYLKDMKTGKITLITKNSKGEVSNGESLNAAITPDGRYIAFDSYATNLTDSKNLEPSLNQVYLKDMNTGDITLISQDGNNNAGNAISYGPNISADGRYISFNSNSTNLITSPATSITSNEYYIKDMKASSGNGISLLSISQDGKSAANGSTEGFISSDGKFAVLDSIATNLTTMKSYGHPFDNQIYLRNLQTSTTTLLTINSHGYTSDGDSYANNMSIDDNYISMGSKADDLIDGIKTNNVYQAYRYNISTKAFELESNSDTSSKVGANSDIDGNYISGDASQIIFTTSATNIISSIKGNHYGQIYMKRINSNKTYWITLKSFNTPMKGWAANALLSRNGNSIVFNGNNNLLNLKSNQVYIYTLPVN